MAAPETDGYALFVKSADYLFVGDEKTRRDAASAAYEAALTRAAGGDLSVLRPQPVGR